MTGRQFGPGLIRSRLRRDERIAGARLTPRAATPTIASFLCGRNRLPVRAATPPSLRTDLLRCLLPLAFASALAGCATPGPEPVASPPAEVVVAPAPIVEPVPPPAAVAAAPAPFTPEIAAQLEPLPPPADDLWERIRKRYSIPDLDDPYVAKWEQWYSSRPDYVARMVDRSRRYLYYIVVEVEQRGIPLEVALLPMVESAFNPTALSTSRAAGIWQFMPATGKDFGMKQTFWFLSIARATLPSPQL